MQVERKVYPIGATMVAVFVNNTGNELIVYGSDYVLEKRNVIGWELVTDSGPTFPGWPVYSVNPGKVARHIFFLNNQPYDPFSLTSGRYRIRMRVTSRGDSGSASWSVYAYFSVRP